jgi:hypothetical protein
MTRFESDIKSIAHPSEKVYGMLSDFDNFESVIASEKIRNWQSIGDKCHFDVEGIGPVGLKIVNKQYAGSIKYSSDGKVPFNFFLWIQLKEVEGGCSKMKLT